MMLYRTTSSLFLQVVVFSTLISNVFCLWDDGSLRKEDDEMMLLKEDKDEKEEISVISSVSSIRKQQEQEATQRATLAQRWNLTDPIISYNTTTVNLTYPITNFITMGMMTYSLRSIVPGYRDCNDNDDSISSLDDDPIWLNHELIPNDALLQNISQFDNNNVAEGGGTFSDGREATVSITLNTMIASSTLSQSEIFVSNKEDNHNDGSDRPHFDDGGKIEVCVRFAFFYISDNPSEGPNEVNVSKNIISISIRSKDDDTTNTNIDNNSSAATVDTFEIVTVHPIPMQECIRVSETYLLYTYECDRETFVPIMKENETKWPLTNNGQILTICIAFNDLYGSNGDTYFDGDDTQIIDLSLLRMDRWDCFNLKQILYQEDLITNGKLLPKNVANVVSVELDIASCIGTTVCTMSISTEASLPPPYLPEFYNSLQFDNGIINATDIFLEGNISMPLLWGGGIYGFKHKIPLDLSPSKFVTTPDPLLSSSSSSRRLLSFEVLFIILFGVTTLYLCVF